MSTRAQIVFEDGTAIVYRHCDGYPTGMLPVLLPVVRANQGARGHDPEYLAARVIAALCAATPGESGIGVSAEIHGDIAYLYVVRADGRIQVIHNGRALDKAGGQGWSREIMTVLEGIPGDFYTVPAKATDGKAEGANAEKAQG